MNKKIISISASIFLCCFIIFIQIRMLTSIKSIYYYDIKALNISSKTGVSEYNIKQNYNSIINYLLNPGTSLLSFDRFTLSENGKRHFQDVKNILTLNMTLIKISFVAFLCFLFLCYRNKDYSFLKYSSYILFTICIVFIICFSINFNFIFTLMHKLLFSNDYWLFDEKTDSIINMLPEKFFFHSGICMLFLIIIWGIILRGLYNIVKR